MALAPSRTGSTPRSETPACTRRRPRTGARSNLRSNRWRRSVCPRHSEITKGQRSKTICGDATAHELALRSGDERRSAYQT